MKTDDFTDRPDSGYRSELERNPEATKRLFEIIDDRDNVQRLIHVSEVGVPALAGIVNQLEESPEIAAVIRSRKSGLRYRQAIGVAVKKKMLERGWGTTGRKGSLSKSKYFKVAEIYEQ
jgi:hypothetical protein